MLSQHINTLLALSATSAELYQRATGKDWPNYFVAARMIQALAGPSECKEPARHVADRVLAETLKAWHGVGVDDVLYPAMFNRNAAQTQSRCAYFLGVFLATGLDVAQMSKQLGFADREIRLRLNAAMQFMLTDAEFRHKVYDIIRLEHG